MQSHIFVVKHELNVFLRLVATSWQNSCQRRCVTLSTNMFTFIIIEVDLYFFFGETRRKQFIFRWF